MHLCPRFGVIAGSVAQQCDSTLTPLGNWVAVSDIPADDRPWIGRFQQTINLGANPEYIARRLSLVPDSMVAPPGGPV